MPTFGFSRSECCPSILGSKQLGQEISLNITLSELQQTLAMRFARCLYGEIERDNSNFHPSFTSKNHFAGMSFTHQDEHDALSIGIHDWLNQLFESTKRCKHRLVGIRVTSVADQLIIVGTVARM